MTVFENVAIEPRVLLRDEPLSNLEAKLRIEMHAEIRDLQRALGLKLDGGRRINLAFRVDCGGAALTVERHRPGLEDLLAAGSAVDVLVPSDSILAFDAETGERL